MPRNSAGVYSLPNGYLAQAGTTIQPNQHNTPLEDIEDALTESLPVNGSRAMTGDLTLLRDATSALHAVPLQQVQALIETTSEDADYTPAAPFTTTTIKAFLDAVQSYLFKPGFLATTAGVLPTGWLECDGSAVSRTTYADLFKALVTDYGFASVTFSVTIASPAVVTAASHGFLGGERLRLSTTGALPTGLATGTDYFVERIDANTFYLLSAARGGSRINTSGSQSGTQTYLRSIWGLGNGTTTFNVPNLTGSNDFLRAASAAALPIGTQQASQNLAHDHTFTGTPVPDHTHMFSANQTSRENGGLDALSSLRDGTSGNDDRTTTAAGGHTPAGTISSSGGTEARPVATAVRFIIKT